MRFVVVSCVRIGTSLMFFAGLELTALSLVSIVCSVSLELQATMRVITPKNNNFFIVLISV